MGVYFKKNMIRRLDAITYDGDRYGRVTGNTVRQNRYSTVSTYKNIANRYRSDETIFKNTVTLMDNIDIINFQNSLEKIKLTEVFNKHGIKKLPDGRRIEDVILVMGKK